MRNRKKIEEQCDKNLKESKNIMQQMAHMLFVQTEVLLDIRELLAKKKP